MNKSCYCSSSVLFVMNSSDLPTLQVRRSLANATMLRINYNLANLSFFHNLFFVPTKYDAITISSSIICTLLLMLTNKPLFVRTTPYELLNPCLPEFSYPKNPENLRPHSSISTKNVTPLQSVQLGKCDPIQRQIPSSLLLGSTPPPGTSLN